MLQQSSIAMLVIFRAGQNHIHTVYIRIFGRKTTKYTVIYGVHIWLWPTLVIVCL